MIDVQVLDVVDFYLTGRKERVTSGGFVTKERSDRGEREVFIAYTIPAFGTRPEGHSGRWFTLDRVVKVTARPPAELFAQV